MAGMSHTLKVGLDNDLALCPRCGTQERVRSVFCLCRAHLQGCFLFLPQLALHRADNKVCLGPPGPVLPRLCYWTCVSYLQGQQPDSLITRGPQRTNPHRDQELLRALKKKKTSICGAPGVFVHGDP